MFTALAESRFHLLLDHLLNLADLLLDFSGEFFVSAFGFQVGVARDLSGCLFDVAFQFMKLAFDLIFRARFHLVSTLFFRELSTKSCFRCFGEVASLLFGLAQLLELTVLPDHISQTGASSCCVEVRVSGATEFAAGRGLGQIASECLSAPTRISPPSATEQKQHYDNNQDRRHFSHLISAQYTAD